MLVLRLQLLEALVLRRKVVFLVLPCHSACRVRGWAQLAAVVALCVCRCCRSCRRRCSLIFGSPEGWAVMLGASEAVRPTTPRPVSHFSQVAVIA